MSSTVRPARHKARLASGYRRNSHGRPTCPDAYAGPTRRQAHQRRARVRQPTAGGVYLIARGKNMGLREAEQANAKQQAFHSYIRETAGTAKPSATDELARLSETKAKGDLTDEEFQRAKEKILH